MDHRIDRVKFDVNFSEQEEARDLQDKFFSICRNGLDRALEGVLEKYELNLSIESIELNLGKIPRRDLEHRLMDLLSEKFEQALISHIEELHQNQSSEKYQLEALTLFLEKGLKHWSDIGKLSLLDLFREVLKRSAGMLIHFMVSTRYQATVVSRLVTLIDEQDFAALISKMRPAEASFILSFIAEVKEVNAREPFSTATTGKNLDDSLRQLVLLDLIKTHGSAFNRRMFIERNLRALAKAFNLSFEELLQHFERVLDEEIPYGMTSTLPGLIHAISEKYHQEETQSDQVNISHAIIFASLIAINESLHQRFQENYAPTLQEYSGEIRSYLLRHTRTSDQVKSLVEKLTEPQLDQLIEVIEPDEHGYIQTYISGAKGVAHEQIAFRSDQAMHAQVYQIVLSYLLIDRGTRFNQKAFLRYQLQGMSQATGVEYRLVLNVFRASLEFMGAAMTSSGMLSFLEEFLSEEETRVIDENFTEDLAVDELELVRQYLKSGTIPAHLRTQIRLPVTQTIQQMLLDEKTRSGLLEFFKEEQEQVLSAMVDFKHTEFEAIIRIILLEHWKLTSAQADKFFERLRKIERQVVYPVAYRKVVFQLLMEPTLKVRQTSYPATSTIHSSEISDVLVYQLQQQLSLPRIMEHPDFENTLDFKGQREVTFSRSRKRLLLAVEDISNDTEAHEKEAIRIAFHKLQQSEFETFALLDHLKQEEVQYLLSSLEKQHFQKLIEQLTVGKWQVLKKSFLLVIRGGARKHQEIAHFFTKILQRRNQSIQQVFLWFQEQYPALDLPNYYDEQVQRQLQQIHAKLELSKDDPQEEQWLTKEHEALIDILSGQGKGADQSETADALFDRLFKRDPNTLFRRLHQLSYRSEAVANYVEKLSIASIEQWIRYETGAGYREFNRLTQNVERFLLSVFKVDRKINLDQKRLSAIRLLFANRVGQYAVSFEQVLRFYMQELAEHAAYKYQLVQQWLSTGLKRGYNDVSSWMAPDQMAALEEEIKPTRGTTHPAEEQVPEGHEEASEELSDLKVPNAGLVLIWPFFQRLFSMLDYLNEENTFKSNVEKSRAVRLLHYICGLEWDAPEYNLTLNKILCGMPFSERMEPGLEITEQEKEVAEQMIGGVIQNWPHLGNTSMSGLQESFLQRNGFLEKEEENWKLRVEKSGIDILIDHMPWSYASVILRWMPGAVYVEWR